MELPKIAIPWKKWKMDFVHVASLILLGITDSFQGFLHVPHVLLNLMLQSGDKNLKENIDFKIMQALKTACIYNLVFTVLILPVLYILFPFCHYILSMIISEDLVSIISKFFYIIGLIFRILPMQIYKIGHFYLFQDIARLVHIKKKGKPQEWESIQLRISDSVFNLIVQFFYGGQLLIISILPSILSIFLPSVILSILFSDWLMYLLLVCLTSVWYSLSLFEYKWYYLAWNLHTRLDCIERDWPYFMGFGLFYAIITMHSDSYWVNALTAGILFPFYIISTYQSDPKENLRVSAIPFFQPSVVVTNLLMKIINKTRSS